MHGLCLARCTSAPQGLVFSFLASRTEEQDEALPLKRGAKCESLDSFSIQELDQRKKLPLGRGHGTARELGRRLKSLSTTGL